MAYSENLERSDIANVVVLLAGSRTGSSYLFRALNATGKFLSPTGEVTPFFRKSGVGRFSGLGYSDEMRDVPSEKVLNDIFKLLAADVGLKTGVCRDANSFAEAFFRRLDLQWPNSVSHETKKKLKANLLLRLQTLPQQTDWGSFYSEWLSELQGLGLDVKPSLLKAGAEHPLELPLLEEPPYVSPEPMIPVTKSMASELPLILKTNSDIYRIPLLRALYPKARFRWIILRRNPGATINALMSGWRSSGFHSHDVSPHYRLEISGYSDSVPGGDRFWKFDMPKGWETYIRSRLQEVCAFQWYSAYNEIANIPKVGEPVYHLNYEDLIKQGEGLLREVIAFAGTHLNENKKYFNLNNVMTVTPPSPGKWKENFSEIVSALERFKEGAALTMAQKMGYGACETWV